MLLSLAFDVDVCSVPIKVCLDINQYANTILTWPGEIINIFSIIAAYNPPVRTLRAIKAAAVFTSARIQAGASGC